MKLCHLGLFALIEYKILTNKMLSKYFFSRASTHYCIALLDASQTSYNF